MTMLSEFLSSRARAEILRILFGTEPAEVHLREIQRQAGMAIGTIRQETARLEKLGLIQSRISGNRSYFSANRRNPLYAPVHELVLKTTGLADVLAKHIHKDGIEFAFVFGSFASGEETPESDIDLFVIGKTGLRALSPQLSEPARILGREINPHVMDLQEFMKRKASGEHFVVRVFESKKIMIIGNEDDLIKLGQ
ncbi:MAG: toxin-antitoxin system toxin subunit [Candidatus Riflebacteria bacterium GWC2_50_8]|nr:MAG: toxin-antitoxin system toxin subunit [Candidatus Riflebacteria bacterium GWC2_50_8]